MRRAEPLEPEMTAALAAIDATLAGDAVDPEHAELAELALILRAQRPAPTPAVANALDERVAARSAPPARRRWQRPGLGWLAAPVAAIAAAVVVVIVVGGTSGPGQQVEALSGRATLHSLAGAASAPSRAALPRNAKAASSSSAAAGSGAAAGSAPALTTALYGSNTSAKSKAPSGPPPAPSSSTQRQVIQSAQLSLSTAPSRIDDVAQQVFDVVDAEKGNVTSSHVTATGNPDGSASFQLSVPVANLQQTLAELSQLHGAHVVSRTDDTSDITGEVGGAGRRLAEARAVRRSLLRQLAAATSTEAIDNLRAQLRDADATIDRDAGALDGLHRQVAYSNLTVMIQASSVPVAPVSHGGGFTLHRAVHDAVRVLVVVAGVALIALAGLVPLGLVVALVAWAGLALARRRREATLDLF